MCDWWDLYLSKVHSSKVCSNTPMCKTDRESHISLWITSLQCFSEILAIVPLLVSQASDCSLQGTQATLSTHLHAQLQADIRWLCQASGKQMKSLQTSCQFALPGVMDCAVHSVGLCRLDICMTISFLISELLLNLNSFHKLVENKCVCSSL